MSRCLTALTLVAAIASAGSAQESRVIVAGAPDFVLRGAQLPISDAAVADIVARHFAETLHGDQTYHLTLVVDADGQYVSGKAVKATIMTRSALDTAAFVARDGSGGAVAVAGAVIRARTGGAAPTATATSGGVVIAGATTGEPAMAHGMFGTDVALADIGSMGMKKYDAGQLGDALIMVTVLKLKP